MLRETKEKVIDGRTYKVTLLGAKAGRAMLVRLTKLLGPAVASFVEGTLHAKGGATESLTSGFAEAVRELTNRLSEAEFAAICDELSKQTAVVIDDEREHREPQLNNIFDDHFSGRYGAMLQWLAFSLEANFASFFGASGPVDSQTVKRRLTALFESLSRSPTASTGTFTGSPQANTTARA